MAKLNASKLDRAHKELKKDARKRIAERGLLQFRADQTRSKRFWRPQTHEIWQLELCCANGFKSDCFGKLAHKSRQTYFNA